MTITLAPARRHHPASTVSVAEYLGHRLRQQGVDHLFGVPGDFNLDLLDALGGVAGLTWVSSPNELGAAYAADGYARSRGFAALVTTYGVGELSCLNAVAGSAAEDVALLHIVGSPSTATVASGALVHHTLADGVFDRFERASAPFTASQQRLTAHGAAAQIDAAVLAALTERKPGYLSIGADLAHLAVDASALDEPLLPASDPAALERFQRRLAPLLDRAERPVLVLGHLVARFGLRAEVARLAHLLTIPVVTQLSAKGSVDEDDPLHAGDYAGTMTNPATAALVAASDLVLHLGTVQSDVLTGQFSARPIDDQTVQLSATRARVGQRSCDQVLFPDAVRILAQVAAGLRPRAAPTAVEHPGVPVEAIEPGSTAEDAALTQAQLWGCVQQWLPAGTAVLADTGTAFWGTMSLRLPADTVVTSQPIWNSIGYALPAVVGQGLADPGRRPVLLVGDGAAQMTVQDLSTIAAAGVRPVILLLNNHGYTIERALQSPDAGYNDVAAWDWGQLLTGLAGARAVHLRVRTAAELRAALRQAEQRSDALVLVEAELDRFDAPPLLRELAARHAGAGGRPAGALDQGVRSARAAD